VQGGAYQRAIGRLRPELRVSVQAAQLLVALAEEGWASDDIATTVARRYLAPMFGGDSPDTLVLGCTHFPLLGAAIRKAVGPDVAIVDSAATTAAFCRTALRDINLISDRAEGSVSFLATDGVERFARVGSVFLGRRIAASDVERVDLRSA
jgi:glutamate racemase